ncbi:hypothetical protein [Pseudomonas sp. NCCP-436]|uniref:hypothetical protein n=1 Tax=Pseudomonas sp. NCCP-436 TaxID=2842481 RepID=UPI001C7F847B|nr:hypothetical protein [Pseudomonas sp. NCCP-436]GIZ13644.1 hypothetical protein NCCP436_30600 [Pseudomonas sp. NCCP-436]
MKIIEPISSSVFITACAYAAGVSHNNAFMRKFGVDPEFSQPSIEKALYDGGVITFEVFYGHLMAMLNFAASGIGLSILAVAALGVIALLLWNRRRIPQLKEKLLEFSTLLGAFTPIGLIGISYIIFLTFSAFNKGTEKGEELALKFIKTCQWIEMNKGKEKHKACAFKKDDNAIWYFELETAGSKTEAKQLSELDSISYLTPQKLIE